MSIRPYLGVVVLLALVSGFMLSACSKPADNEIAEAQKAIDYAREMGADIHSAKKLDRSFQLLEEAKNLNQQGDYSKARDKAEQAKMEAEKAAEDSERMEGARTE